MKNQKTITSLTFLGLFGGVSALTLSGLTFGLGVGWQLIYEQPEIASFVPNIFQEMAGSLLLSTAFFVIFVVSLRLNVKVFSNIICFFSLIFLFLQCRIFWGQIPDELPQWVTNYSVHLKFVLYSNYLFFVLLSLIGILFVYRIIREKLTRTGDTEVAQ